MRMSLAARRRYVGFIGFAALAAAGFAHGIEPCAFGADADVSGLKDGFDKNPVFAAYLARVQQEYRALSPTPNDWDGFNAAVNKMWETLPAFTAAQLRTFSTPTTIADGEYDEGIRPEHNRYLASTIPHATLVILPNISHFAMLQNPSEFNAAVLDFLAR
jgi:pimeloyl-ACP methyl ester carboxylesterase